MFSYALRQIQPRVGKPESRAFPRNCRRWFVGIYISLKEEILRRDDYELYADRFWKRSSLIFYTRTENARPSLTGQERSGPAGRLPLLCYFLFTNCTATSVLFINFYFCCYVCLLLLVPVTVFTYAYACDSVFTYVSSCEMFLSRVAIKWSCEDGVIRVVSY